jgi:hypothetical protein
MRPPKLLIYKKWLANDGMLDLSVALLFDMRDLWIGIYWKQERKPFYDVLILYICIIPTLPIKIIRRI